jgi:ADP-heptose:LPS heptosyltransferase
MQGIGDEPLVLIHPGSGDNFPGRRWPPERFGRLADALVESHGARVVVTGAPSEAPVTAEVRSAARRSILDAAGEFTIRELVALVERADLLCSNDTAPVHIAAALRRPVLGFYGPNTPLLYGPVGTGHVSFYKGLPCSPCITNFNYKTSFCRMPVCISNIGVDEVVRAARGILDRGRAGSSVREVV